MTRSLRMPHQPCPAGFGERVGSGRAKPGSARSLALALALAVLGAACGAPALACSVPVFRFALDRWAADRYRLEVPQAELRAEPLASEFRNLGTASALNLEVAAGPPGNARLRFPSREGRAESVAWEGALTPEAYASLVDSPARREIASRILGGASAVWVLVDGGDAAVNEALVATLGRRLKFLESAMGLPSIDPADPTSRLGPGPELRLSLEWVRVRGDAPGEAALVRQLAGPREGAGVSAGIPFAALVFGRGRVLGAWPATRLTEDFIEEATRFVVGACSCEVKSLNPGWDLLLRGDWERGLAEAEALRKSTPAAHRGPADSAPAGRGRLDAVPETVVYGPTGAPSEPGPAEDPDRTTRWVVLVGALVAIPLAAFLFKPRL